MCNHSHRSIWTSRGRRIPVLALIAWLSACGEGPLTATVGGAICDLNPDLLRALRAPDAIPALTAPDMVGPTDPAADYLADSDVVLGLYLNGEARAYPHNILWYHEIVNDQIGPDNVSVTFCPLTGSGLAFAPELDSRTLDIGVSGLLFANNLVLFDRLTEDVYGPQLGVDGACGAFRGQSLPLLPVQQMAWGRWKQLHPNTTVISGEQAFGRTYTVYPYGSYDEVTSNELLMQMSVDRTRPIKERVLAIRQGDSGRGYPYGELSALGSVSAVNETVGGVQTVVFYDASDGQTALAFDARVRGQLLTFDADPGGFWTDRETGSTWALDGSATAGVLSGERLSTRSDAYTLFWFAWRHFQPDGRMFSAQ